MYILKILFILFYIIKCIYFIIMYHFNFYVIINMLIMHIYNLDVNTDYSWAVVVVDIIFIKASHSKWQI